MALQKKNDLSDRPPSKLLRYGLTGFCVFVWSCIDYPYSIWWFLGMMLVSMKNSDKPNKDEPCDGGEVPQAGDD